MNTTFKIAAMVALCGAAGAQAHAQAFEGPTIGLEAGYEDYDGAEGQTVSLLAGWDFAAGPGWVLGVGARWTLDGVEDGQTEPAGLNIQTTRVSIEDQWGVSVRAGQVFGDRLLVFGEVGYEQMHVSAQRDLLAPVCAPPNGCLISRLDGSFDEDMITYGVGAEWAMDGNWRLRGAYTFSDSDAFERNRFAVSAALNF